MLHDDVRPDTLVWEEKRGSVGFPCNWGSGVEHPYVSRVTVRGPGIVLNPRRSEEMHPAPELIVGAPEVSHGM